MAKHMVLGRSGESIASSYLQQKGHVILALNYRYSRKEIDIISVCEEVLVFTEIKSRNGAGFGFPEEAVTLKKQASLKFAAEGYCQEHPEYDQFRFDVISILFESGTVAELLHFEDAFY